MYLQSDTVLMSLPLFFACLMTTTTMAQHVFPGRNFDKSIRNNCTMCTAKLQINVAEVLPRLTLIKQRILNALGRRGINEEMRNDRPYSDDSPPALYKRFQVPTTQKPVPRRNPRTDEIISFSEPTGTSHGDPVMKFRVLDDRKSENIEAVSASLLLFVERRRQMRKDGRGKKISLQISKLDLENDSEEILTYLRTRVKRCKWKKLSLPVRLAQSLLDTESGSIDIKVRCTGCGRLVNVVIYGSKETSGISTMKRHSRHERKVENYRRRKDGRHRHKHRHRHGRNPILVISTRYRL